MKQYNNIFASLLLLAILFCGCSNQQQSSQTEVATPVYVTELKKGSISKFINTTGTANPDYGVELNSEMSGEYKLQINPKTGKLFKLGDVVSKGQIIIRLEDEEYVNGIAIESKKMDLEIAEQEKINQESLRELGGVTITEMRNTEARITNARYSLENAKLNLEKMDIRAPFNGVIVDLPHYSPGVKVSQGSLMVSLMDYKQMYMDINLPESAIKYVSVSQPVHITHYTLPEDTLSAFISELSPAISTETRTFKGKILIQNNELKLRPGMFVKADIVVDKAEESVIIPKNVIQSSRQRKFVYIVERNMAVSRTIETGIEDDYNVEVISGLYENDNLITRGFETLRDNSRVKVQN
ncbi:efflux RND transporter periplasmic adaptor subunit [Bacteroidales bacterium OttesenSCG-928-A17]|nr:efflux RND transporter periplasmic adaptor subunit [Bacteroidales bacterium OttesenSCG-928-A17]